LFDEVVWAADEEGLLSDEHFSVDGTLIEAAARFHPPEDPAIMYLYFRDTTLQSGAPGQAPGRTGGGRRAVRMNPQRFCAPTRDARGFAGPPKPAPWDRNGASRALRTAYTSLPHAFGVAEGIPNLFFSSLL
ncbi:MAG: hypothetical protein OXG36_15295, partial [Caldilineaceae bacterium]|nr:hypothetical protein [Caldilineaceae bacterium]